MQVSRWPRWSLCNPAPGFWSLWCRHDCRVVTRWHWKALFHRSGSKKGSYESSSKFAIWGLTLNNIVHLQKLSSVARPQNGVLIRPFAMSSSKASHSHFFVCLFRWFVGWGFLFFCSCASIKLYLQNWWQAKFGLKATDCLLLSLKNMVWIRIYNNNSNYS